MYKKMVNMSARIPARNGTEVIIRMVTSSCFMVAENGLFFRRDASSPDLVTTGFKVKTV